MASQIIIKPILTTFRRNYSSIGKYINVSKNKATGISILSMAKPPVNNFNIEMLVEFRESLNKIQENDSTGVIITSNLSTTFSAGLDIMELINPNMINIHKLWNELQETWLTLYGLSIPTVAAINGWSPAGGCAFAMSCDYRVFVEGKHKIGLSESQLGLIAPVWAKNLYIDTIGYRLAEKSLLNGTLFSPEEALAIGLVDELATDKDNAIIKCEKYIANLAKIPAYAKMTLKNVLRSDRIEWLKQNREDDTERFVHLMVRGDTQAALKSHIQTLKEKKI